MRIRELCREDLPALRILEDRCFSDAWSDGILRDLPESSYDRCRVLEDGAKVIGYVNIRVLGDEAELMRICILPEYRGQGLSAGLLESGMEDMIRCGAKEATLEVRAGNLPAVRLDEAGEGGGVALLGAPLRGARLCFGGIPEGILPRSEGGCGDLLEP